MESLDAQEPDQPAWAVASFLAVVVAGLVATAAAAAVLAVAFLA